MYFHEKMKEIRKDNDTSQRRIAKALNMSQQQYSLYENNKRPMPTEVLLDFCKYFNVSADYVLGLPKNSYWPR